MTTTTAAPGGGDGERLARIAALIHPCPAPDVLNGEDLCSGHREPWPCDLTTAAWLARRIDPAAAVRAAISGALAWQEAPW